MYSANLIQWRVMKFSMGGGGYFLGAERESRRKILFFGEKTGHREDNDLKYSHFSDFQPGILPQFSRGETPKLYRSGGRPPSPPL